MTDTQTSLIKITGTGDRAVTAVHSTDFHQNTPPTSSVNYSRLSTFTPTSFAVVFLKIDIHSIFDNDKNKKEINIWFHYRSNHKRCL